MNIILFILYVLLSSFGLILFKLGTINPTIHLNFFKFSFAFSIKTIIGLVFYCLSFILWMLIISRTNLTVAMPLSIALVNTIVVIGSCIFLKEKITFLQGIGIFIVVFGVCIMTYGGRNN